MAGDAILRDITIKNNAYAKLEPDFGLLSLKGYLIHEQTTFDRLLMVIAAFLVPTNTPCIVICQFALMQWLQLGVRFLVIKL